MRLRNGIVGTIVVAAVQSLSLDDVCTVSHVQNSLPAEGSISGIEVDLSSVTASPVYSASTASENFFPAADDFAYCNVTLSYAHTGKNDKVNLKFWLPSPSSFKNRYLATGGGGFAINSGEGSLPGGVIYGAVAGTTDGGFGGFSVNLDDIILKGNGSLNYDPLFMFAYKAIGENTKLGKMLTGSFYGTTEKIYTYYQGCSEGGREGWSQVQRNPDEYDGVITGAPAFRFAQQQVAHLYSNVVEKTQEYYPPPCELAKIVNETIAFCDPLDGVTDGVVSRTDLCLLQLDMASFVGKPYSCAASTGGGGMGPPGSGSPTPAQNGSITAEGAKLATTIINGLHTTDDKRGYISYQPSSGFSDAQTKYSNATGKFELSINSMGGEWVTKFLQEVELDNLPSLENVTYDMLVDWMTQGMIKYADTLQTTLPDLTAYQAHGGKVLHFHGESDDSIPAGSSVHYHESVRKIMYANQTFNASQEALGDWYRLFLVPGAGHCAPSTLQPNGPFPNTNLQVMIDWVENGVKPTTLAAQVLSGSNQGKKGQLCAWPLRPYGGNSTTQGCVYDQKSIDTWMYDFDAYKIPVY
jgi:tannase